MVYTKRPVIVRDLFDRSTYSVIERFMNEWLPLIPLATDRDDHDSFTRFGRRYAHNLKFFADIHEQLVPYASALFGEEVKASYSFLSMYDKEGQCPLHIDRPQCRYTIDYLIRQESKEPWPIAIGPQMSDKEVASISATHPQTEQDRQSVIDSVEWTTCLLNVNDAVCYSGTHAWHYRPTPSVGTADLVFFHFVPRRFRGSLD